MRNEVKWIGSKNRLSINSFFEVSTRGNELGKKFSAFNAIMKDGRSIEEHYQEDVKGYPRGQGKGKLPLNRNINIWESYLALWKEWAKDNPDLISVLDAEVKKYDDTLSDRFANTPNNQARALTEILNERRRKTLLNYFD